MNDITICVKAFERIDAVSRLLESINKYYGELYTVLIGDDSAEDYSSYFTNFNNVKYYKLPYDVGISAGRNFLVSKVKTKYFIICDDDFIFTKDTNIEKMKLLLEKYDLDILGGRYNNTHKKDAVGKNFEFENNMMYIRALKTFDKEVILCDMVPNFFIAKTTKVNNLKWDEELKILEHSDFFIRAKNTGFKVGYCNDIYVIHDRITSIEYNKMRNDRAKYFKKKMCEKYNLTNYKFI